MNFFDWLIYLWFGFIQGLSEILPISSSGHLALFQQFFNISLDQRLTFSLLLHVGSLFALILYFYPLLRRLTLSAFTWIWNMMRRQPIAPKVMDDVRYVFWIGVATLPAALAGLLLKPVIENVLSDLWFVGGGFLISGFIVNRLAIPLPESPKPVGFIHALFAGFFQVLGVFPGISRSGSTLLGTRMSGLSWMKAKEMSFLMFLPITLGAFLVDVLSWDLSLINMSTDRGSAMMVAMLVSACTTYLALHALLNWLKPIHFRYFSVYLLVVGILTILLATMF